LGDRGWDVGVGMWGGGEWSGDHLGGTMGWDGVELERELERG